MASPLDTSLIDLADVSLDDLMNMDNPVLAENMRRVKEAADGPQDIVAGFNSAI